jgi:hypothetical protein
MIPFQFFISFFVQPCKHSCSENRSLTSALSELRSPPLHEELANIQDAHSSLQRTPAQAIASQKNQITNPTHQSSFPEDKLPPAGQIVLERNHTISELQGQLSDLAATQGSLLLADAEQEKKEGRVLNFVRGIPSPGRAKPWSRRTSS